mgnify:CR=1 FL=1
MLGDISVVDDIYIVCGYTDMRKQIDGLYSIVKDQFHMDPERYIFSVAGVVTGSKHFYMKTMASYYYIKD